MDIVLSPVTGLRDTTIFPDDPGSSAAAREQIQGIIDQVITQANAQLADIAQSSGTWTPVFDLAGFTYDETLTKGYWFKSGKFVKCIFKIKVTSVPSSGNIYNITGLPFAAAQGDIGGGALGYYYGLSLPANFRGVQLNINSAKNAISFGWVSSDGNFYQFAYNNIPINGIITGEISYWTP